MASRRKIGVLQSLLLAASVTALSVGAASIAHAQQAESLNDLGNQILNDPTNVELNMRYARAAEAQGSLRMALTAYERILINDPDNAEARRGYERIRREIEPGYTVTRFEAGARWDSNAANLNDFDFYDFEGTTYFAKLMIANESEFFDHRWRTIFNANYEDAPPIEFIGDMDYLYLGVQTGPIFKAGPHLALLPALGVGKSWIDQDEYFEEAYLSLGLEGRSTGFSYWARLRGGVRQYEGRDGFFFIGPVAEGDAPYAELQAGITKPGVFTDGSDALLVNPFVRWSDGDGSIFDFSIFDEVFPSNYLEYGIDANYNYQLTDHIQLSAGALYRERDFGDSAREDQYFSPQASVTWQRGLGCDCDIQLQYRYRENDSNSFANEYEADQVTLSLRTRF